MRSECKESEQSVNSAYANDYFDAQLLSFNLIYKRYMFLFTIAWKPLNTEINRINSEERALN